MPAHPTGMVPDAYQVLVLQVVLVELVGVPILILALTHHQHSDQRMSHHPYVNKVIQLHPLQNTHIIYSEAYPYMIVINHKCTMYIYLV